MERGHGRAAARRSRHAVKENVRNGLLQKAERDGRADILWQHDNGTAAVCLMNGLSVASYGPALPNPGADWHVI